jgi:hypothetical protein
VDKSLNFGDGLSETNVLSLGGKVVTEICALLLFFWFSPFFICCWFWGVSDSIEFGRIKGALNFC